MYLKEECVLVHSTVDAYPLCGSKTQIHELQYSVHVMVRTLSLTWVCTEICSEWAWYIKKNKVMTEKKKVIKMFI